MTNKADPSELEQLGERLAFVGLDRSALNQLKSNGPLIERAMSAALDEFYKAVRETPAIMRLFRDEKHIEHARTAQNRHWQSFVTGNVDANYIAAVRRIGNAHARIGLEPRWYIAGYSLLFDQLIRHAVDHHLPKPAFGMLSRSNPAALADLLVALVKAVLIDLDYSISVYIEVLENDRKRAEAARLRAQEDAEKEQQRATANQRRAFDEAEARKDEMHLVLEKLGHGLKNLASKNLVGRVDENLPTGFRQLATDFNSALEQIEAALQRVAVSAQSINGGAGEVATASDDLAQRTEQQAANLEQTTAAIAEIAGQIHKAAENAVVASKVVGTAMDAAQEARLIIEKTNKAMKSIESSSEQIGKIIGVIDEIAFQTNLLALNAGVEAARAGDSGRGFAVVASEVRALAQRSATAAKEIKTLISTSGAQVSEGVRLVADTGRQLQRFVEDVNTVSSVVTSIADSAKDQSQSLSEVRNAANQLDRITQQNAAMAEQANAASRSLRDETQRLTGLIDEFKLNPAGRAIASAAKPSRPVRMASTGN